MGQAELELLLVAIGAMLSPTTLSFSVLALVLGEHPLRTGLWFFLGAFTATLAVGVVAAFALEGAAAAPSGSSSPKTWVAVLDIVLGALALPYAVRLFRRPRDPVAEQSMIDRMSRVASSPAIAIVGAGAMLANPGGFIPVALKDISQLNPNAGEYLLYWVGFTFIALAPLLVALVALVFARERTMRVLGGARDWLTGNAFRVGAVLVAVIGIVLLRDGIAGLT